MGQTCLFEAKFAKYQIVQNVTSHSKNNPPTPRPHPLHDVICACPLIASSPDSIYFSVYTKCKSEQQYQELANILSVTWFVQGTYTQIIDIWKYSFGKRIFANVYDLSRIAIAL